MISADKQQLQSLDALLAEGPFTGIPMSSLEVLKTEIRSRKKPVALLDLDTLALDNRKIERIMGANPQTILIGLSGRRFHPELEEALRTSLFACLTQPIDPEELGYLLKDVFD